MRFFKFFTFFLISLSILDCVSLQPSTSDFKYTKNESGITITGYLGTDINVIIPDEIDGISVVKIETIIVPGFFSIEDNNTIRSISIPSSVNYVESYAFSHCRALQSITLLDYKDKDLTKIFNQNLIFNSGMKILIEPQIIGRKELYNKNNNLININSYEEYELYASNNYPTLRTKKNTFFNLELNGKSIGRYIDKEPSIDIVEYTDTVFSIKINDKSGNNKPETTIYRNEEIIVKGTDFEYITAVLNDAYYYKKHNDIATIYKNNTILKSNIYGLSYFSVDNGGNNLAYTIIDKDGTMKLYKNDILYTQSKI